MAVSVLKTAAPLPAQNAQLHPAPPLSRRAYSRMSTSSSWEELWEAGGYYQRISELLEEAKEFVVFVGWQVDSRLPLQRPPRLDAPSERETLKQKVIRLCEEKPELEIYFLMWDHAYFYCLERETMQYRTWEDVHPRIHFIFDNRHPFGGSHHEKLVLVDGKVALCGGIDLCDERWDSPQHLFFDPRRSLGWKKEHHGPYHDVAVQVTGPVCQHLHDHISTRWKAISSIPFPKPKSSEREGVHGDHQVYFSRTQTAVDIPGQGKKPIIREVEFLARELVARANDRIVIENQYYWSESFNNALIAKMMEMRGRPFEVILILAELSRLKSLTKQMAYHELRLLERLEKAAHYSGTRLVMGAPYAYPPPEIFSERARDRSNAKAVYVHSKLLLIDDRYLSVGSANLSDRAFRLDSEVNLTFEARSDAERAHLRKVADRILSHWNIEGREDHHVHLRRFRPASELHRLQAHHPILTRFPWKWFFDPKLPWAFPIKRRFGRMERRKSWLLTAVLVGLWALGAATSMALSGIATLSPDSQTAWAQLYTAILASCWLIPAPFTALSFLAAIHLGPELGSYTAVNSFWVVSIIGYCIARAFPTPSGRYFRKTAPGWLPAKLGLRSFPYLFSVIVDPRVSLRSKIAYQGLYSVPMVWFGLGTLLFLASLLFTLTRHASAALPAVFLEAVRNQAPLLLVLMALATLGIMIKRWHGKGSTSRPLLQHS